MGRELSFIAAIILIIMGLFFFWKSDDFVKNEIVKDKLRQKIKIAQQDLFLDIQYNKLAHLTALKAKYYNRPANHYIETQYEEGNLITFVERVYNQHFIGVCAKKDNFTSAEKKKFKNSLKSHPLFKTKGNVFSQNPVNITEPHSCIMIMNNTLVSMEFSELPENVKKYMFSSIIDSQKSE